MVPLVKSTEEFDFSVLEPNSDEVITLINKIQSIVDQSAILYLDWQFIFSVDPSAEDFEQEFPYGRISDDSQPYSIPIMGRVYNHFLLSVITGSPERYPFNCVSCNYAVADRPVISIKGFYAGSKIQVPTANDVELRPLGLYGHLPSSIVNLEEMANG